MLCKKCEKVILGNETVCFYCGTTALDIQKENIGSKKNNILYANRKRNRKKIREITLLT